MPEPLSALELTTMVFPDGSEVGVGGQVACGEGFKVSVGSGEVGITSGQAVATVLARAVVVWKTATAVSRCVMDSCVWDGGGKVGDVHVPHLLVAETRKTAKINQAKGFFITYLSFFLSH